MYTADQLIEDGNFTQREVDEFMSNMDDRSPAARTQDDGLAPLPGFDAPSAATAVAAAHQSSSDDPAVACWAAAGGSDRQWTLFCSCTKKYLSPKRPGAKKVTRRMLDHQQQCHTGDERARNLAVITKGPPDIAPAPVLTDVGEVDMAAAYHFHGPQLLEECAMVAEGREARRACEAEFVEVRVRHCMPKFAALGQVSHVEFCVDRTLGKLFVDSECELFHSNVMPYVKLVDGFVDFDELIEVINAQIKALGLKGADDIVNYGQRAEKLLRLKTLAQTLDNKTRYAKKSTLRRKDETIWRMMSQYFFSGVNEMGHNTLTTDLLASTVKLTLRDSLLVAAAGAAVSGVNAGDDQSGDTWTTTLLRVRRTADGRTVAHVERRSRNRGAAHTIVVDAAGWDLAFAVEAAGGAIAAVTRTAAALQQTAETAAAAASAVVLLAEQPGIAPAGSGGNVAATVHLRMADVNRHTEPSTGTMTWLPGCCNDRVEQTVTGSLPPAPGSATTGEARATKHQAAPPVALPTAVLETALQRVGGVSKGAQPVRNAAATPMRPAAVIGNVRAAGLALMRKSAFHLKVASRYREKHAAEDRLADVIDSSADTAPAAGGDGHDLACAITALAEDDPDLAEVLEQHETILGLQRIIDDGTRACDSEAVATAEGELDALLTTIMEDEGGYGDALLDGGLTDLAAVGAGCVGTHMSVDLGPGDVTLVADPEESDTTSDSDGDGVFVDGDDVPEDDDMMWDSD